MAAENRAAASCEGFETEDTTIDFLFLWWGTKVPTGSASTPRRQMKEELRFADGAWDRNPACGPPGMCDTRQHAGVRAEVGRGGVCRSARARWVCDALPFWVLGSPTQNLSRWEPPLAGQSCQPQSSDQVVPGPHCPVEKSR